MALLEVKNAVFSYDGKRNVLDDVSFSVEPGQVFCVVGPNGCGKSTLIDNVLGLSKLKSGSILLSGKDIRAMKPREMAEQIAYVPQGHKTSFPYTVMDVVIMGRTHTAKMFSAPSEQEKQCAGEALEMVGLAGFEDREYTRLSGGELQLVLIARALAQQARLLVMDEPTAHLDFRHELNIMEVVTMLVKERRIAILMATHFLNQAYYLENAGVSTRVALMNDSKFMCVGTPTDVLTPEHLESVFNIVTEVAEDGQHLRKYILALYNRRENEQT